MSDAWPIPAQRHTINTVEVTAAASRGLLEWREMDEMLFRKGIGLTREQNEVGVRSNDFLKGEREISLVLCTKDILSTAPPQHIVAIRLVIKGHPRLTPDRTKYAEPFDLFEPGRTLFVLLPEC